MRALKTFMRNRKAEMLWCGPCECRTLQCWRYANENCGCGEGKSSLPNYVRTLEDESGQYWIRLFNENMEQNNNLKIEEDTDTGGIRLVVWEFLLIKDENTRILWYWMRDSMGAEVVEKLFWRDGGNTWVWHFTPEAMAQFNALINNPTEEQADILKEWLEDRASDESPIVIFDFSIIRGDLTSLDGDELAEQISAAAEVGVFELLINGNTYTFEPVSEESCDVYVNIDGIEYSTGVQIDDETGKRIVVVWEITVVSQPTQG